ncbi:transposase [Chryseobacterium angstadtii]|uniref:Transposase n=1 Tax=Chryseobacterium angstadtii TaxID=558151 RepID=A0A0J7I5P4_9FLAO|nr:transposase [Chryseobacterium angstadtii]KMQ61683.1 transposase [Chryseobacterium angstadtii]
MDLKEINIGPLIKMEVENSDIDISRICNFMKCTEQEAVDMYTQHELSTDLLLKWSKLLKYDFFRLYSQHLIFYAPQKDPVGAHIKKKSMLPSFRKNLYTSEMIRFILELIRTEKKSKKEVIEEYNIPKTTLHKWLDKY